MTATSLMLVALIGQVSPIAPADLVKRLGASRYAERERASSALEALGPRALPALQQSREQKDPEVRSRGVALLEKIEGSLLTKASLVSLDFQDRPLAEVVKSFNEQTGMTLTLDPENSPRWREQNVTLRHPDSLPFWKALDRLSEVAHITYFNGVNTFPNGGDAGVSLHDGWVPQSAPVFDSGPFRVSLVTLHYQRDVTFVPTSPGGRHLADRQTPRADTQILEQFFAQMQVAAEPRLSLVQTGPVKIVEAVDDKENILVAPASSTNDIRRSGYFGYSSGSVLPVQLSFVHPEHPGRSIKRLRGSVPVEVSSRKPNPLVVPLTDANGRTSQNEDVAVTIHEVKAALTSPPATIELTIRTAGNELTFNESGSIRPETHQQQLEILSANGRPMPWHQVSYDTDSGHMLISLTEHDDNATPRELRYYRLIRAKTDVPFAFHDVPMP